MADTLVKRRNETMREIIEREKFDLFASRIGRAAAIVNGPDGKEDKSYSLYSRTSLKNGRATKAGVYAVVIYDAPLPNCADDIADLKRALCKIAGKRADDITRLMVCHYGNDFPERGIVYATFKAV